MEKDFIDFKHSLEVLQKLNAVTLDGVPLINAFFIGSYNIWHTYQSRLFALIQEHDFKKDVTLKSGEGARLGLRWFIAGMVSVTLSVVALLILILCRKKVLVYSVDKAHSRFGSDTRLDDVYQSLKKNRLPFTECFHTFLGRDFRRNILKRKRPALYLESLDFIYDVLAVLHIVAPPMKIDTARLDMSHFEDEREKAFALTLIEAYVHRTRIFKFKNRILSRVLSMTSVTYLFGTDDPRAYFELLLACKENGIACSVFQHGSITKYHVGWLHALHATGDVIKPDKIFVWSNFWKEELLRLGTYYTPEEIEVSGAPEALRMHVSEKVTHEGIRILVPHERAASKEEVRQYILRFIACGAKVFFKVRPGVDGSLQLREYSFEKNTWGESFVVIDTLEGILNEIDFVAGTYSTFLYDMVAYGKLVICMKTKVDYGEGMLVNDLVEPLDIHDDVCAKLHSFLDIPHEKLDQRKERLFETGGKRMEDTLDKLLSTVMRG